MRRHLVLVTLVVLAAGCGGSSSPQRPTAAPTSEASRLSATTNATSAWPTYHRTGNRAGDAGSTMPALTGTLRVQWRRPLDGAVYGQPILVGSTAIAATENDSVYAMSVATGAVLWRRHLGTPMPQSALPCGNIDPLGVTGTPTYDAASGSVFVVAETLGGVHTLYALAASTGAVRWHRSLDLQSTRDKRAQQQRSALLVAAGRVIVSFGGLYGDCGNYVGYVTSTPVTGQGSTTTYTVPTRREAGMWAPGGQALGPNGLVYASSGNGAATAGTWDGSDSVLALNPLTMKRSYSFHPALWAQDNLQDLDLGSMSPVVVGSRVVIAGKRGTVYLLSDHLAQLSARSGCTGFGGGAVRGSTAYLPCTAGVRAVRVGTASLTFLWQAAGIPGSPVLSGTVAYALDPGAGRFYELSLATGQVLRSLSLGTRISRFASPTVANGGHTVLVPTMTGVVAVV